MTSCEKLAEPVEIPSTVWSHRTAAVDEQPSFSRDVVNSRTFITTIAALTQLFTNTNSTTTCASHVTDRFLLVGIVGHQLMDDIPAAAITQAIKELNKLGLY